MDLYPELSQQECLSGQKSLVRSYRRTTPNWPLSDVPQSWTTAQQGGGVSNKVANPCRYLQHLSSVQNFAQKFWARLLRWQRIDLSVYDVCALTTYWKQTFKLSISVLIISLSKWNVREQKAWEPDSMFFKAYSGFFEACNAEPHDELKWNPPFTKKSTIFLQLCLLEK